MANFITKSQGELIYLASPQMSAIPRLSHAFFTRRGGVSGGMFSSLNFRFGAGDSEADVARNYAIGAGLLGAQPDQIARTRQQHTDNIALVRKTDGTDTAFCDGPVDALITDVPGICLTGFYADCQLIMIYDRRAEACAVVHCGWRGVANQLLGKTIDKMCREFGSKTADMTVAVGPSICRRCFETEDDVPAAMTEAYGEIVRDYIYRENGKWHVDLKNITYMALVRMGVPPFNIDISNHCTKCTTDEGRKESLFWSHRREGENRGVHAGMIMIKGLAGSAERLRCVQAD